MRLIIIGEGPLEKEFDVEEHFRVPGNEDGIPYSFITHRMFYGRRSVPDYWGLVLNYADGRKFLTDPKGHLTREKVRGLQGVYWLPKEHLGSLDREPVSIQEPPKKAAATSRHGHIETFRLGNGVDLEMVYLEGGSFSDGFPGLG